MKGARLSVVSARVSAEERRDIVYVAEMEGRSVSELIRASVLACVRNRIRERSEVAGKA